MDKTEKLLFADVLFKELKKRKIAIKSFKLDDYVGLGNYFLDVCIITHNIEELHYTKIIDRLEYHGFGLVKALEDCIEHLSAYGVCEDDNDELVEENKRLVEQNEYLEFLNKGLKNKIDKLKIDNR